MYIALLMINLLCVSFGQSTAVPDSNAYILSVQDENFSQSVVDFHRRGDYNEHSADDIYWLYQCVEAEEGNNNYRSKYLAACCILNRVRLGWGDSITDVIFSKNQFEVVRNNRINTAKPSTETIKACNNALDNCEEWVIAFAQGNLHRSWATVCEVHNGEYYYKSK